MTGLTENTEYAVCLSVTNLESPSKTTVSAPVAFKTSLAPEKPEALSPALLTATTATFEGILNPKATVAAKNGWYFAYSPEQDGPACVDAFTTQVRTGSRRQSQARGSESDRSRTEQEIHALYARDQFSGGSDAEQRSAF